MARFLCEHDGHVSQLTLGVCELCLAVDVHNDEGADDQDDGRGECRGKRRDRIIN